MKATDKLKNFFELNLIPQVPEVIYFEMSDGEEIDRLVSDAVSEVVYPGVFLLRPQYRFGGPDKTDRYCYFDVKFYVFCKTNIAEDGVDDITAREDEDLGAAEAIANKLANLLAEYNSNDDTYDLTYCPIDFDFNNWVAVPVKGEMTTDNPLGYEISFKLGLPAYDIA